MTDSDNTLRIDVSWVGDRRFEATNDLGATVVVDGASQSSLSPMQGLLASLCGCVGIDVILILQKMRAEVRELEISIQGTRNEDPPKYFRDINLQFNVTASAARDRVERAVQLSFEKYCSVLHTLRKDIGIDVSIKHHE